MSMLNRPMNGSDLGEVIASTRDYEVAQKTVSKLIAGEVPARDIAIVGEGVRTVERVTGRLGYAAAARSGAINGVLIGLVLSAVMLFGNPDAPISLFLGFILVGVALGMIMSLVTYAIVRRRRDFASVSQMIADHYEVRVQAASLAKARQVVGPERPAATRPPVDLSEPPRYGERISQAGSGAGAGAGSGSGAGTAHAPAGLPEPAAHPAPAPHTAPAPPPPPPLPAPAMPGTSETSAAPAVPADTDAPASDGVGAESANAGDDDAPGDGDAAGDDDAPGDAAGDGDAADDGREPPASGR
ncbi:general stress protein [Microbacterium alcoholitolerans]|uniref:general stress protein n=1 Tax=unclassified Microbacterium TaxID=2609290 RepID=UPI003D168A57